jgi:spermidine/putrescine ABC transporter ATP-binding subunit
MLQQELRAVRHRRDGVRASAVDRWPSRHRTLDQTRVMGSNDDARRVAGAAGASLVVRGLTKRYGRSVDALRNVDLTVQPGEFLTLLGPSGSGKTTLLMVVAGFVQPTEGRVLLGSVDITAMPPEKRNFGVVFQNYALFPHMSVERNVAYPLQVRRVGREERARRVRHALHLVGLAGLDARRPAQLSGGQQQRVALARALVYQPSILLLDEPLGALDRALREQMQVELGRLHRLLGVTFIYVTHDQEEALTMSDRIAVLRAGEVEQVGTPQQIYERPATEFVARFVGKPNVLAGRVVRTEGRRATVRLADDSEVRVPMAADVPAQGAVLVLARVEKASVDQQRPLGATGIAVEGVVLDVEFGGASWRYSVGTHLGELRGDLPRRLDHVDRGSRVVVSWRENDLWAVPGSSAGPDSTVNGTR